MNEELQELIRVARRKVRSASGVPLTADDQAEERRQAEIKKMETFLYPKFGLTIMMAVNLRTAYRGTHAVGELTVEGKMFQLQKDGTAFVLLALKDSGDVELSRIEGEDPAFADRVLVTIADYCAT